MEEGLVTYVVEILGQMMQERVNKRIESRQLDDDNSESVRTRLFKRQYPLTQKYESKRVFYFRLNINYK
jgi:hypothetical protein